MLYAEGAPKLNLDLIIPPEGMPNLIPYKEDSWILLPETAIWIGQVLQHYGQMPKLFYKAQRINDKYWRVILSASVEAAHADGYLQGVTQQSKWPALVDIVTWISIAVVSIGVGFVFGMIAHSVG